MTEFYCPECEDDCKRIEHVYLKANVYQEFYINKVGKISVKDIEINDFADSFYRCINCGYEDIHIDSFLKKEDEL